MEIKVKNSQKINFKIILISQKICIIYSIYTDLNSKEVEKMRKTQMAQLEQEREKLLRQWTNNRENRVKLLVKIMELEEEIEALKRGA